MGEVGRVLSHGERRRYPRFQLSQALAYQWGETKGMLHTVDLSLGGTKIQTKSPMPVDETLSLILLLKYEAIKPVGKTVWASPSSYRTHTIGISFDTIPHQCLKRLERFLNGIPLREKLEKQETVLDPYGLRALECRSFEMDRLRANFLRWLHRSYPWDYDRYADRLDIGENEVRDFLRSKGIDRFNVHYLLKSLRGG